MSDVHSVARDQLRALIERIERLEEEKKTIADDIKDVKAEAKGCGFDVGIINILLKLRKKDAAERAEEDALLDTYMAALGMIPEPFEAEEPHDADTGELDPKLAHTIVTGMQTEIGRAALLAAVDIMIDREEKNTRSDAPPASAAAVISSSNGTAIGEAGSLLGLPDNSPETADELQHPVSHATGATARPGGDDSMVRGARTEADAVTDRRDDHLIPEPDGGAISEVKAMSRLENADGVEPPPSVTTPKPAPSMDELRIANALILRPSCKRPGQETCGGQGRTHCRDCITSPAEKVREEA